MGRNAENQARWRERQQAYYAALHLENARLRDDARGRTRALLIQVDELKAEIEELRAHIAKMHAGHFAGRHDPLVRVILGLDRR
jgi:hypothetical protein